jgi:hypothetical protein
MNKICKLKDWCDQELPGCPTDKCKMCNERVKWVVELLHTIREGEDNVKE